MKNFDEIIKFVPAIVERPWGREEWIVSARKENPSLVKWSIESMYFDVFLKHFGLKIMGPRWERNQNFSVLGKKLICDDDLSLQVHPTRSAAKQYGGEPKEEFWFVIDHREGARVLAGFEKFVTKENFKAAIESGNPEHYFHELLCYRGASLFIPSGRAHAICGGVEIFEMQQSAGDDSTYRVWDYNRPGLDGKLRQLHVEEALASMIFDDVKPHFLDSRKVKNGAVLVECQSFRECQYRCDANEIRSLANFGQPQIIYIVSGSIVCAPGMTSLEKGEAALVPYDMDLSVAAGDLGAHFLVTDEFFIN